MIEKWVIFKRDYLEISFLRENCGYDGSDERRRSVTLTSIRMSAANSDGKPDAKPDVKPDDSVSQCGSKTSAATSTSSSSSRFRAKVMAKRAALAAEAKGLQLQQELESEH